MKVTYKPLPEKVQQGYGISRWGSAREINESLKELTDKNIYSIPEDKYKEICSEYYDVKCAGSKEITAEAKKFIPGGVQQAIPNVYG